MIEFISIHGEFIQKYISYKRSLGYKFTYDYSFSQFDRFLYENHYEDIPLSKDICRSWEERRPNETDASRYQRVGLIHNYALYLQRLGYPTHIPEHLYPFKSTFTPYIFSEKELQTFFYVCDIPTPNASPAFPAIFRLIYSCGLRKEEALNIKLQDIFLDKKIIYIRDSKNHYERMLPLTESMALIISNYCREYRSNVDGNSFLFVTRHGTKISGSALYHRFRLLLEMAGISHGGRGKGPRIHDLRHSFSVHTLAKIAESGMDIYTFLPILSKYLGHKSIQATEGYVRLTAELFPKLMEDINSTCSYVYPEVNVYETSD